MTEIIDGLSVILPILSVLLVLAVILINVYIKIRSQFSIRVNCWFCNENTRVPYIEKNSFICPSCTQYNGFDIDGSYNKAIPAQHYEMLNTLPATNNQNSTIYANSNGLCRICNNNQQLKIYQLANFIPLSQNNFDLEVEHFQKQLENAYKLCPKCDSVVKKTISKQTKWMLGLKIKHLRNKGLSYLNLNESSNKISKQRKKSYFLLFLNTSIFLIASLVLINVLSNFNLSTNKQLIHYFLPVIAFIRKNVFQMWFTMQNQIQLTTNIDFNQIHNMPVINNFQLYLNPYSPIFVLSTTGLFLQCVVTLFDKNQVNMHLFEVIFWMFINGALYHQKLVYVYNGIMICSTICILYFKAFGNHSTQTSSTFSKKQPSRNSYQKSLRKSYDKGVSNTSYKNSPHNSTDISDTDTVDSDYEVFNATLKNKKKKKSKVSSNMHVFGEEFILGNSLNHSKSPTSFEEFQNMNATKLVNKDSIFNKTLNNTIKPSLNNTLNYSPANDLNRSSSSAFNNNLNVHLNQSVNLDPNRRLSSMHEFGSHFNNFNNCSNGQPNVGLFNTLNSGLNQSLDNLSLFTSPSKVSSPLISPSKLNLQRNPWTGTFWDQNNVSRTSSQSSGFVSQHTGNVGEHSLPNTRSNSVTGDFDRNSMISEPLPSPQVYNQFSDLSHNSHFVDRKSNGQCFPSLNPNDHIFIQGKQSIDNSSLRNRFQNEFSMSHNVPKNTFFSQNKMNNINSQ